MHLGSSLFLGVSLGWLSGVTVTCFAASYAVVLALEISRLFFRSGIRGAVMIGFAGAGLLAHTVYLFHRAVDAPVSPLSSKQDWYMLAAWVLVVVYLYLLYYHPKAAFGLFILPLVLALVGVGTFLADSRPFAPQPASETWGMIHGTSVLFATVTVLVGFAAGLMYLGQAYRLKRKLPPKPGLRLPSLEWLQRVNSRAIVVSLLFLGVGIVSGIILNRIDYKYGSSPVPWTDPFVVSTVAMFGWLLVCTGVLTLYRPAREGRRVACLTLVSFVFLAVALGVGLSVATEHLRPRSSQGRGDVRPAEVEGRRAAADSRSTRDGRRRLRNKALPHTPLHLAPGTLFRPAGVVSIFAIARHPCPGGLA